MAKQTHNEVNDCRPQVIEHFIGQRQNIQRSRIALESAWNQGTKLPHILMQGRFRRPRHQKRKYLI